MTPFSDVDELQELVCCALVGLLASNHAHYGLSRDDLIRLLGAGLLGLAAIDALLAAILVAGTLPRPAEPPPVLSIAKDLPAQPRETAPVPPLPDGLVVATPQNVRALLAQPDPPQRVWWERAGLELCLVPAGAFPMGTRAEDVRALQRQLGGEQVWYEDETPRHTLYLDAYYIGRGPVTQAQYARFVRQSRHRVPFRDVDWARPYNWDRARRAPPAGKEEHPVVLVDWEDALAYCRWAGVGLPSEAEWEKAASWDAAAGHKRTFPWGDVWDPGRCNTSEGGRGGTTPVGAYSPQGDGPYGCADMAGNVWEWTRSLWRRDTSWDKPTEFGYPYDPADGREDLAAEGTRVVRGGSFALLRGGARCAARGGDYPGDDWIIIGFRVVVSSISGSGL